MASIKLVLKSYSESFLIVVACFFFAFFLSEICSIVYSKIYMLVGSGLILWGTLSYLINWKVQTWGGKTLPEKINKNLFRGSYIIGTVLIFLGILGN